MHSFAFFSFAFANYIISDIDKNNNVHRIKRGLWNFKQKCTNFKCEKVIEKEIICGKNDRNIEKIKK